MGSGIGPVVLVVFLATFAIIQATYLVLRDLFAPASRKAPRSRYRRPVAVHDTPEASSTRGRLDLAFERLAVESGSGYSGVTAFMGMLVSGLAAGGAMLLWLDSPIVAIGATMLGMAAFLAMLNLDRQKRWRMIRHQLPDLLDLLSRAVRAGQSVDQGLQLAAEELDGVLADECARCSQELEFGRGLSSVLKRLSDRVRIPEMRLFTMTLTVQRQTGGNLGETLERMAAVMRDRVATQRQVRAATGAGRAAALVVSMTGPIAFVAITLINPKHMEIFYTDPLGQSLLMGAFVLELIGIAMVVALLQRQG